jgi:hypothetical protein
MLCTKVKDGNIKAAQDMQERRKVLVIVLTACLK